MYFIFCRTSPPDMHSSSHRTTTTFCPFNTSFAIIDASRPSMWCLASTTTLFEQIPDPETILLSQRFQSSGSLSLNLSTAAARVLVICLFIPSSASLWSILVSLGLIFFFFLTFWPNQLFGLLPFFSPIKHPFCTTASFFSFFFYNY